MHLLTKLFVAINLKTVSDSSTCNNPMKWTGWHSAYDANDGNDFEILADHVKLFGLVFDHFAY